ncbi:MAG: T9SS type A sorting domain-containing protein [Bacteroidota bacterium]|jgi:hypothetical protein
MKQKKLKFSAFILLGLGLTNGVKAQTAIAASGGTASGSSGNVNYTVGQIVYTTNTGTNNSAAEGVQQPYEISGVTGLTETSGIILSTSIYPNPTSDFVILKIGNYKVSDLSYQLFDLKGCQMESKKVNGIETNIDLSELIPATYFLKVIENNKEIKTFKIIKN